MQESVVDSRVESTLHSTTPLIECDLLESRWGRVEIGECVEHLVAHLRLLIQALDRDVIYFFVVEEILADVVGQFVRLPFDRITVISDLHTVDLKSCLVRGYLLLVELEVWGEEGQLFVNDTVQKQHRRIRLVVP